MKRIVWGSVSLLLLTVIYLVGNSRAARPKFPSTFEGMSEQGKEMYKRESSRFEVSPAGALTLIRSADGKQEYQGLDDGYSVAYEAVDPKSANAKQREENVKIFHANGEKFPSDLFYCKECERNIHNQSGLKDPINQAVASAATHDGVLMVHSTFQYDPKEKILKARRQISNISADEEMQGILKKEDPQYKRSDQVVNIRLHSTFVQYSPRLRSPIVTRVGIYPTGKSVPKKSAAVEGNRMSLGQFAEGFLPVSTAALRSTCGWCPTQCDELFSLTSTERRTLCIDCPGETAKIEGVPNPLDKTLVQYLKGDLTQNDPPCNHPILIDDASGKGSEVGVQSGGAVTVCVKCPVAEGKDFASTKSGMGPLIFAGETCTFKARIERDSKKIGSLQSLPGSGGLNSLGFMSQGVSQKKKSRDREAWLPKEILRPNESIVLETYYSLRLFK